jgi:hydrogenase maturation protease
MVNTLILGIGNPYRGDDGAGWAVIEGLQTAVPLRKSRGDIAELIDLFSQYEAIYVIDACLGSRPAGSWERIDLRCQPLPEDALQVSTHGFGLAQALPLANQLNVLPATLILYAIWGDSYTLREGLSNAVTTAVKEVITALHQETQI